MRLFDYQKAVVDRVLKKWEKGRGVLLKMDVGLGKTLIASFLANVWFKMKRVMTVIFVPASLFNQWCEKLIEYGIDFESLRGLQLDGFVQSKPLLILSYHSLNYQNIKRLCANKVIIVDEIGNFKNIKTKRSEQLNSLTAYPIRLALTGSLVENEFAEVYYQIAWARPKLFKKGEFSDYVVYDNWGGISGCKNLIKFKRKLKRIVINVTRKWLNDHGYTGKGENLTEVVPETVEVIMNDKWQQEHDKRGRKLLRSIQEMLYEDGDLDDLNYELIKMMNKADVQKRILWLRKFISNPRKAGRFKVAKTIELIRKLDTHGEGSGIIFCEFVRTAELLKEALEKEFGNVELLVGSLSAKRKTDIQHRFIEGKTKIIVGTPMASRGLDLFNGNFVIHYDIPWNPAVIQQRSGRINRVISKGSKYIYYIPIANTVEEYIYGITLDKIALEHALFRDSSVDTVSRRKESWLKYLRRKLNESS